MGQLSEKAHIITQNAREELLNAIANYLQEKQAFDEASAICFNDLKVSVFLEDSDEVFVSIVKKIWLSEDGISLQYIDNQGVIVVEDAAIMSMNELYIIATEME